MNSINIAASRIEKLTPTRIATDGREMKLVKRMENGRVLYADPSLVTVHHYADFLNEMRDDLEVIDGVVRYKQDIWIYLGMAVPRPIKYFISIRVFIYGRQNGLRNGIADHLSRSQSLCSPL